MKLYNEMVQERLNSYFIFDIKAEELIKLYPKCAYCGCKLGIGIYSIEHIKNPKSGSEKDLKGTDINTKENIVLCCRGCNASKGNKTLRAWFNRIKDKTLPDTEYLTQEERKLIKKYTCNSKNPTIKEMAQEIFAK